MLSYRKKFIAIVATLCLVLTPTITAAASYEDGYEAGRMHGEQHAHSALGVSFASGFLFGLLGGLGSVGYYAVTDASPDGRTMNALRDESSEYRNGFRDGYEGAASSDMMSRSLLGAGTGVLGSYVVLAAAWRASYDGTGAGVGGFEAQGDTLRMELYSTTW